LHTPPSNNYKEPKNKVCSEEIFRFFAIFRAKKFHTKAKYTVSFAYRVLLRWIIGQQDYTRNDDQNVNAVFSKT